jgi:F-box-like
MELRQRKNARALISRLPVEILIQVFSYYAASDRQPHVRFRTPPPWLAVTHVCQRWRRAALSCPVLWVDIISTNYRWTEEMLERSSDLPIHITVDDGGPSAHVPCEVRTARLLFSKIHRAQSLAITCADADRILACLPILFEAEAAPVLQELTITDFHSSNAVDLVERPLFSGRTPTLQFLSLYHCRVLWSSPLFQCDLVYLFISHIPHEHRPHLQQLLDVLKSLTRLECLQLDEALPIHISSPTESLTSLLSVERLFLYRLRFFSLCAKSAFDILDLTARVLVPASALFQLICEEFERYTPSIDSGDVMLAALASHLCAPRGAPAGSSSINNSSSVDAWASVRSLHVRDIPAARSWSLFAGTGGPVDTNVIADAYTRNVDDSPDAELTSSSSSNDKNNDNADKGARPPNPADEQMHILLLHLRWHAYPTSAHSAACFIQRAARLPPLVRASTLLIESDLFESATAWRAAFARARHVRAVFAGGDKAVAGAAKMLRDVHQSQPQSHSQPRDLAGTGGEDADVYAAITRLLPSRLAFERPAENPPRVLFPKLRRLAIAGADFEDAEAGLFESLRAGLVARKESGGGSLAQLSIWRCDVLKDQLDALGALVAESKVRWDGVLSSSRPASEARDSNAELRPVHMPTTGQGNNWQGAATIIEEPEIGHGDGDLPPIEGHNPLLVPGEFIELDED